MSTHNYLSDFARTTEDIHKIVTELHNTAQDQLTAIRSILRHPRSLARPTASWRPPQARLSAANHHTLTAALSRYRVGPLAQSRVRGYGEQRTPAYVVSVRITAPSGDTPSAPLAEAWIRALIPPEFINAVHRIDTTFETVAIYAWLVDANYILVHSPASIFAGFSRAA